MSASAPGSPAELQPDTPDTGSPAEVVRTLVNASHGLTWGSGPGIAELLEVVRLDPDAHIPHLLGYLDVEALTDSEDPSAVLRGEIASQVLVQAGGESGRKALADQLQVLYQASDELKAELEGFEAGAGAELSESARAEALLLRQQLSQLVQVEKTIVSAFGEAQDPRLAGLLMERLVQEDLSTQLVYVQYLLQIAADDRDAREFLEGLLKDPGSQFFDSPMLKEVIGSID